jgi:hypothetical protein
VRSTAGQQLRERRERLSVSRYRLAALCGHSPAHLASIEAGWVPKHGIVLADAEAALAAVESERANGSPAAPKATRLPANSAKRGRDADTA